MERANEFLGHPHVLTQTVRHGRRVGHAIGVPTVNLVPPENVLTPKRGVYAAKVILPSGEARTAVTNVGVRPTVERGGALTVESWLPGFDGDLYGQTLRVEFYRRLRGEVAFPSLEALKAQIARDADAAQSFFAET